MDKKMVFVITTALAASYGLGELELGTAKAAIPTPKEETLRAEVSPAQKSGVESLAVSALQIVAAAAFGSGVVQLTDAKKAGVCFDWEDIGGAAETAFISSRISKPGEWNAE